MNKIEYYKEVKKVIIKEQLEKQQENKKVIDAYKVFTKKNNPRFESYK